MPRWVLGLSLTNQESVEKMLSFLRYWELEGCSYGLLAAMFPATRRQSKKGEGKVKWERTKEYLCFTPGLVILQSRKPPFVCELV